MIERYVIVVIWYTKIMSIWKKYEITLKKEYKRACVLDQHFVKKRAWNKQKATHRNEDNSVRVMEWWEVSFLQHHLNKYVVFKIRIKCHHQSTQRVPPRPGFVRCCTNASRHEACLLGATVRQQWHTHACIHSYTYREKADAKERSSSWEKEGGKEKPWSLRVDESFKDRARQCTPAKVGLERALRGQPALHRLHLGTTQRSPLAWPCPLFPWSKETRPTYFMLWTS